MSPNVLGIRRLTWREQETVELVAEGLTNRAIALRMGVSVRTVEGHLNHVFAKLGIESRTELVRLVLTGGLA
jgi:DNA-binding NarL/FixJ family response regulator